jgi:hypothetical protein
MRPDKTRIKGKEDLLDLLETQDLIGLRAGLYRTYGTSQEE